MLKSLRLSLMAAALLAAAGAQAGRSCEAQKPTLESVRQSLNLAQNVAQALDASGAQVLLLGRQGQDLSKYQLQFSHMG